MAKIPSQMQTRFNDEVDRVCVNWPTGRKTNAKNRRACVCAIAKCRNGRGDGNGKKARGAAGPGSGQARDWLGSDPGQVTHAAGRRISAAVASV